MKILFVGESLASRSGLSKVIVRLMKGFHDNNFKVTYCNTNMQECDNRNWNIYGEEYKYLFYDTNIYNTPLHDRGRYKDFDKVVDKEQPDIVISCLDPWKLDQIYHCTGRNQFYWVHYGLFETPEYPENCMSDDFYDNTSIKRIGDFLKNVDLHIPVTQMGIDVLKRLNCKNISENVYLGLDLDKKIKDNLTKQEVFGTRVSNDDFIFMTMGRNSERKKLDKVVEAFYLFLKQKNFDTKYKLYIHSNIFESVGGSDLIEMIRSLNIANNVLVPSCFRDGIDMSDEDLNKRYSICDCYISLPAGGGFEYGFIESMLYNKPIIYSNYGGFVEYCEKYPNSYKCDINDYFMARNILMKWALPNMNEVVKHMNTVVTERKKYSDYDVSQFDWELLINKFIDILMYNYEYNYDKKEKSTYSLKRIV